MVKTPIVLTLKLQRSPGNIPQITEKLYPSVQGQASAEQKRVSRLSQSSPALEVAEITPHEVAT